MTVTKRSAISNEEIIAKFRDWRSRWNPTTDQIEDEIFYISKLAEFMAPVPVSKVTKTVKQDFYQEEFMRPQASRSELLSTRIHFDAFLADLKAGRV